MKIHAQNHGRKPLSATTFYTLLFLCLCFSGLYLNGGVVPVPVTSLPSQWEPGHHANAPSTATGIPPLVSATTLIKPPAPPRAAPRPPLAVPRVAKVLMVVFSIGRPFGGVAKRSHLAYAARHGYDFREVKHYLGSDKRGHVWKALSLQKILACTLARSHDFVLVLDSDVVIGPWTPPIHLAFPDIGRRVGIVNENQPSQTTVSKIMRLRTGNYRTARSYYLQYGYDVHPLGLLNSGVMLFQPKYHAELLEKMYYGHVEKQVTRKGGFHYEQAMVGYELMKRDLVYPMPHAWNRLWVFYDWSVDVKERKYWLGEVFRKSYFVHFCWDKPGMLKLNEWAKKNNVTFAPEPYSQSILP